MLSSYQRTSGYTVRQIEFPESMEGTITVKELGVGNVKLKRVYEKQGGELKAWLVKCHHDQEVLFGVENRQEAEEFYELQLQVKTMNTGGRCMPAGLQQQKEVHASAGCSANAHEHLSAVAVRAREAFPQGRVQNSAADMCFKTPAVSGSPRVRPSDDTLHAVCVGTTRSSIMPGQLQKPPCNMPQQQQPPKPTGRLLAAASAVRPKPLACPSASAVTATAAVVSRAQRRDPDHTAQTITGFADCNICLRVGSPGLMQGTLLQLGAQVDAGGFGTIYAVKDRHDLLVKVFVSPKGCFDNNLARKEMLVLKLLQDLEIDGILQILGGGHLLPGACQCESVCELLDTHEVLGMVMPRLEMSVEQLLEAGHLSAKQIANFARRGLKVLDALHHGQPDINIVHRDIKPANMLVDERGNLFFADFGSAGIFNVPNDSKSNMGSTAFNRTTMAGTTAYMGGQLLEAVFSKASKAEAYDALIADCQALGMSLVHMLIGPADAYMRFKKNCIPDVPSAAQHIHQVLCAVQHGYGPLDHVIGRSEYRPVLGLILSLLTARSGVDCKALLRSLDKSLIRHCPRTVAHH